MNFKSRRIPFMIVFILFFLTGAYAQASDEPAPKTNDPKTSDPSSAEIERLKAEMEKLQSVVEQQQQLLLEMQKRLTEIDSRTSGAIVAATPNLSAKTATPNAAPVATQPGKLESNLSSSTQPSPSPTTQTKNGDKSIGVAGWDNTSAFIRSADGRFETRVTGFAQFDFRGYQSGTHPPNTYLVRRARMRTDALLDKYFEVRIEAELTDTTSILLRDFYARIHRIDEAQLTVGQFREPFSQEELRPEPSQDFVEKSLVNLIVPARSPGLMLSGVINNGAFEYQIGSFNGKGLLVNNNVGTPENALRLRFAPFKNGKTFWLKGLAFGGAVAQGKTDVAPGFRGQTNSRSFTFFTPDTVHGKIVRTNGELTWLLGPAVLRAEYDQTNQDRDNLGLNGTNLPGVVSKGYMAQFTYLLTGETKSENGATTPKRSLFSVENGRMGFGAWELKARYDNLQIADGTAKSNRSASFYFGANWYMNRFVKYMLDFGYERFKDPLRVPRSGDKNFFVTMSRIQVAF